MLRTHSTLLALLPMIALGYSACVAAPDTEDPEAVFEEEAAIATPNPALIGTFRPERLEVGKLALLVLKADGTYHRGTLVKCVMAPCNPAADDGQYTLTYRGRETFLWLTPEGEGGMDRYQYVLKGGYLRLMRLGDAEWMTLAKTDGAAWCEETLDCRLQNLPTGPCATDWYCSANVCQYSCWPPGEVE